MYISPLGLKKVPTSGISMSLLDLEVKLYKAESLILSHPSRYNSLKKNGLASSAMIESVSPETFGQNFKQRTLS